MLDNRLIRLPEVMALTGMSRSWIYQRIHEEAFPSPIKLGRASCWDVNSVRAFLDEQIDAASVALRKGASQ